MCAVQGCVGGDCVMSFKIEFNCILYITYNEDAIVVLWDIVML